MDDCQNQIPDEFLGIPFHAWLDIFLEYAMALSHSGDTKKAYEVISSASEANVFYHCPESLLIIYVCWFSKSLDTTCYLDELRLLSQPVLSWQMTKKLCVALPAGSSKITNL